MARLCRPPGHRGPEGSPRRPGALGRAPSARRRRLRPAQRRRPHLRARRPGRRQRRHFRGIERGARQAFSRLCALAKASGEAAAAQRAGIPAWKALYDLLGVESNPIPGQGACSRAWASATGCGLPLLPLSAGHNARADAMAALCQRVEHELPLIPLTIATPSPRPRRGAIPGDHHDHALVPFPPAADRRRGHRHAFPGRAAPGPAASSAMDAKYQDSVQNQPAGSSAGPGCAVATRVRWWCPDAGANAGSGASVSTGVPAAGAVASFTVADSVDSAWRRIGIALGNIEGVSNVEPAQALGSYEVTFQGSHHAGARAVGRWPDERGGAGSRTASRLATGAAARSFWACSRRAWAESTRPAAASRKGAPGAPFFISAVPGLAQRSSLSSLPGLAVPLAPRRAAGPCGW